MDLRDIITKDVTVSNLKKARKSKFQRIIKDSPPHRGTKFIFLDKWAEDLTTSDIIELFRHNYTVRELGSKKYKKILASLRGSIWTHKQKLDAAHHGMLPEERKKTNLRERQEQKERKKRIPQTMKLIRRELASFGKKEVAALADSRFDSFDALHGYFSEKYDIDAGANPYHEIISDNKVTFMLEDALEEEGWADPRFSPGDGVHPDWSGTYGIKDPGKLIRLLKARRRWELKWWGITNLPAKITRKNLKRAMKTKRPLIRSKIHLT